MGVTATTVPCWRYTRRGRGIWGWGYGYVSPGDWIPYPPFFWDTLDGVKNLGPGHRVGLCGKSHHGPARAMRGGPLQTVVTGQRVGRLGVVGKPQTGIIVIISPGISRECARREVLRYSRPIETKNLPDIMTTPRPIRADSPPTGGCPGESTPIGAIVYSITYYHPRTRVLRAVTTPTRVVAWDTYGALVRSGFVARAWLNGEPIRIARG